MVKVVIGKTAMPRNSSDPSWDSERKSVEALVAAKESHAYRETKAARIAVTYVEGQSIFQEKDGVVRRIGRIKPHVKVSVAEK